MLRLVLDRIRRKISHPNGTFIKLINYLLVNVQMRLRTSYVLGYPYYITIDPTNYCDLHCPLCPTGQRDTSQPRGKMSFRTFKKIIDELGKYLYSVDLFNWGEPLLNKEVYEMVSYANKKNIWTNISTNFNQFDQGGAKEMILSGLDHLVISLDGASPETYCAYRVGGNFNKVIDNIKLLAKTKEELQSKKPILEWQFLPMKHNEHEIAKAKAMAAQLGVDEFTLRPMRVDMGKEVFEDISELLEEDNDWLPKNEEYSRYDYKKGSRKTNLQLCPFLWTTVAIGWDGAVYPCCAVYPEKYSFGNVLKKSFKEIWNGQAYRQSRKLLRKKSKAKTETVCGICLQHGPIDYVVPLDEGN